jgi:two-component system response regulator DesR
LSIAATPFTTEHSSVTSGTDLRQMLIANQPLVAGSGSKLEAFLITETHHLRHTPNFQGTGINGKEVLDLVRQCTQSALLFLVDSIAADGGEALLHQLRQEKHPPLVLYVSGTRRWQSREQLDLFPAHALLSVDSVGSGRFNAALATMLGGSRYVDELLLQQASQPIEATSKLSSRELEVTLGVTQGLTNRDISLQLYIAESTVRDYVSSALKKLSLNNRAALAAWATQHGLHPATTTFVGPKHDR